MKKKFNLLIRGALDSRIKKILMYMKLTCLVILLGVVQTFAGKSSAQTANISVNLRNVTVETVLQSVEEQTDFYFLYSRSLIDVNRKVDLQVRDVKIADLLNILFDGTTVSWGINGRQIVLLESESRSEQQQKTVSGKVTDSSGMPLPGVTVIVLGTAVGVITDINGSYSISNVPSNATLQYSFVGMKKCEVTVAGKSIVDAVLEEETFGIEEVVAIGYGTVKKNDLTGAVGQVQGESIAERQTTELSQALQGAVSGVMVSRNNSAPGSAALIRIRGITTIGESDPLIIVDGVPVDNINDINPNDVENMSVLKDAASASIYGSRAASGVILITTKRAKSGEVSLNYNAEYGFEKPTTLPEFVDVKRYMQMVNELRWNDNNNNANEYPTYTKDVIENYDALNAENPNKYPNTDWVGLILKGNAPRQSHVLNIAAGAKAIRTKASVAYDKIDALYEGRTYERITARFNNDVTITKNLSVSLDLNFKRSISEQPFYDPMYNMLISPPVYAAKWADGRVADGKNGNNIWGMMKFGGTSNVWLNQVGGKMAIDYTPIEGMKISAVVSPTLGFDKYKSFQLKNPYYSADDPTVLAGHLEGGATTNLYEYRNDNHRVTSQVLVNYLKSVGSHNFNAMAGYENYYAFNENLGASREKYELTSFPYLDLGPLEQRGNAGNALENGYRSYFGRVLYNFKNKYFLQGNIRYDGSSRFHKDYRWGAFPSFSAGWVVSEESFLKNIPAISFLKLRASWGTLGNERIGNYPYQATIAFSNALFFQSNNVVSAQTAAQTQYAIQDISWETTESIDLGVDLSFFDNRLKFTGDYYQKTTKDMLLALEIPDYIGFENPDQNTGKMDTKGWEAEISWNGKIGDVGYTISANISDFKSKMGDLGGIEFISDQINKKGSEYCEWYGYVSDGLFQTAEDLAASPKLNTAVKAGDAKYRDISGPDGVPDGQITPTYDRVLLGGSLPRYMFGSNIKLDYKNVDLSMVLQGVGKVNSRLQGTMVVPLIENWGNFPKILDGTSWSYYNTAEQNLAAKYPRFSEANKGINYAMSDYWLFNGAYLRIKNITVGYTLPLNLVQKVNLQKVRLYASASDILTFDKFPKGWDPEVAVSGYPITTSFLFGLSVTF